MRKIPNLETLATAGSQLDELGGRTLSRRFVLGGAALAGVGAVCLMTTAASAQTKQAQADVQYQGSPKDGAKCSGCALFQPPDACTGVEGKISPEGWCSIYSPKA